MGASFFQWGADASIIPCTTSAFKLAGNCKLNSGSVWTLKQHIGSRLISYGIYLKPMWMDCQTDIALLVA